MRAIPRLVLSCGFLSMALPAMAQDAAATLRIQGNVMVSSGGEFTTATDGQPVVAGQRIMVGDDGSATVNYGPDCKRSYESAGVYLVEPSRCEQRKNDDKSQQKQQQQQASGQGSPTGGNAAAVGNGGTWTTLGIALGSAIAGAAALQQGDDVPPDRPVSR